MAARFLFRSGGRRLVADSLLRPRPVAVPGTLLQAAPLPPTHGALLRPFLNSRLASSSSTPPPPPQNETVFICVEKNLAVSMLKAVEDIDKNKLASDMRRFALHGSWAELSVVDSPNQNVDFSTFGKSVRSLQAALEPGPGDFTYAAPFMTFVALFTFLLVNNKLANVEKMVQNFKEYLKSIVGV